VDTSATADPPQREAPAFRNDIGRSDTVIQAANIQSLHLPEDKGAWVWHDYWHPDTTGANFIGRDAELDMLARALESAGCIARIQSIQGMAGVGKTELAVAYAHRIKHRFEGHVFFDFQSYAVDRIRVTAEQALARMLPTVAGLAPEEVERLSGMQLLSVWQAVTAGRRLLMVWDNVKHPDQVRPLLVRNDGCASIVVSRDTIAVDHWESPIRLDVMAEEDAVELARQIIGDDPSASEVLRLVRGNMYVPVLIASQARAVRGGTMSLQEVLAELPKASRAIDEGSQRDLFDRLDGSYLNLDPDQRLAFKLIGSHPGTFATLEAAASVLRCDLQRARELLDSLVLAGLLTRVHHEQGADELPFRSYSAHDLLRSYGAHRAQLERDEDSMLDALAEYYQDRLDRYAEDDHGWYALESGNIRDTALAGEGERHVRLAQSLGWLSYGLGQHGVAGTVLQHAREILSENDNWHELGMAHLGLGHIALTREEFDVADDYYGMAATDFARAGDRFWEATAIRGTGYALTGMGVHLDAREQLGIASDLFTACGHPETAAEMAPETEELELRISHEADLYPHQP
jgi:tetratricopeptide (TPR) repeat protein